MAGGIVYQLKGSQIKVLTGFDASSPSGVITGVSRANPAVVSETNHGRSDGDVVQINGVVGMTDLNGTTAVINVTGASTYELLGIDSSGYAAYVSGGVVDGAMFSNFCNLTDYEREGGVSSEINVTVLCSDSAEFLVGDPDYGVTTVGYMFAPLTNIQSAVQAAYAANTPFAVQIVLPEGGGTLVQMGKVQKTTEKVSVQDPVWKGSFQMRNSGPRYDFVTA